MAIISTLSGTVKYSIFCFLFLLMGIIRFMPFLTYYRNHKKWVCRMADPFAHFLFSCKRTVVVPCAFSLCELPREWDTTGCFRIFPLFSDSLPRMWNKLRKSTNFQSWLWLTPTRAGQTEIRKGTEQPTPTHSHSCGTDLCEFWLGDAMRDSFPLAWDKLPVQQIQNLSDRLIPTHVGQTSRKLFRMSPCQIHSHPCGSFITIAVLSNFTPRFIPT